ncbi:MAG TPA: tetratricopeptide repeat protein, partial [Gemmatimonadales bacterium]|nr:tetratricopeptide repeat protein [Gemmatimonadales bacterium]
MSAPAPGAATAPPSAGAFLATFGLVLAAILALFAVDTFLANLEHAEQRSEAVRLFTEGERLARQGRHGAAIDRYRSAIALARGNDGYRLALGRAQLAAGRPAAAESTMAELLRRDATDGPANLTMAHVLLAEGRLPDAISYYHHAIYGRWPSDARGNRVRTRLELVDLLARRHAQQELLAELLPLQGEVGDDPALQPRLGELFIAAGSPARAAAVYRAMLRRDPRDPQALAGLGAAQFAAGEYRAAHGTLQAAARLAPDDAAIQAELDRAARVLAIDPLARGLGRAERLRRSAGLVDSAAAALERCGDATALQPLVDSARAAAARRAPAADDAIEANLDLAL